MNFWQKLWRPFEKNAGDLDPEKGYDVWAASYDEQPDNLMLALDEKVFTELANAFSITDRNVVDVGCGTGRHWPMIMHAMPRSLTGYDVSLGMLQRLQQKFPQAQTHQLHSNQLLETADASTHILISTLTIAHIQYIQDALTEWNRILLPGAYIIITDYHPGILAKGGRRTFTHEGETIGVKNYVHSIEAIQQIAKQLGWQMKRLEEKIIDKNVKPYYDKQNALKVYEKYKGMPVIYGILFKKINAA
jgi:ubiquinone/menaquinone biosynthesis C-methylase UbiE